MGAILCCFEEIFDCIDDHQKEETNDEQLESIDLKHSNNRSEQASSSQTRLRQNSAIENINSSNESNHKNSRRVNNNSNTSRRRNDTRRNSHGRLENRTNLQNFNSNKSHTSCKSRNIHRSENYSMNIKFSDILMQINTNSSNWQPMNKEKVFIFANLHKSSEEFLKIQRTFLCSANNNLITVLSIDRIQNPYIYGRYLLKKKHMKIIHKTEPKEYIMFHGVKAFLANSICSTNFDWRLNKIVSEDSLQKGVHFSPVSNHAIQYCDKDNIKKIIVAKVLVGNMYSGSVNLPWFSDSMNDIRYDSAIREKVPVIVKFYDDEFYPAYIIRFVIKLAEKNSNSEA